MKKLLNEDIGKVFKRNLSIILTIVVLLTGSFIVFYIIRGNEALKQQIQQIEQQDLETISTGAEYAFNQISEICNYYTNIQMTELQSPYDEVNYYSFLAMKKQIDISKSLYSAISNVYIKNSKNSYYTSGFTLADKMETIKKESFGKIGNTEMCKMSIPNADYSIFFEFLTEEGMQGINNVYIEIDSYQMAKLLFRDSRSEQRKYLVDNRGNIIFTDRSSEIAKNISELYNIPFRYNPNTIQKVKYNGKDYFFSTRKISDLDLYAVSLSNKKMYNNYFTQTYSVNIALSVVFLIIACVAGLIMLWVTYKPIRSISKELNKYGSSLDMYNKDEVKYITTITKNLYFENKELNNSIYEKVNEIRNSQIKMLQAQICPHFICNTLDAMNWLVYRYIKERNNPLSSTIQNMSLILQENLNLTTMFTTIRAEIEITKRYVEILHVRHENSFEVAWDIDETVLQNIIIKLCIQPLIENVAAHAFSGVTYRRKINIAVKSQGADILVSVKDNGVGMSEEHLQEVISNVNDFSCSGKHIGMRNINYRLILLYGEQYKLLIQSSLGNGTTCSFRIPKNLPFK